ncbi:DNA methyltransferase [Methylorubrum subtropicum]|uniref:DNA methyltransferase n=1 Tax=Methylorubrum subtropicum TaxID=3138812 RepID=UPI00399CD2B6
MSLPYTKSGSEPLPPGGLKHEYSPIHVNRSTFKAGLASRVHRWFRLTPSFGPDLVQHMLDRMQCSPQDIVLDPFAGAGTTLIECKLSNINSVGFEMSGVSTFETD